MNTEQIKIYLEQANATFYGDGTKLSISHNNEKLTNIPSVSFPPLLTCADECRETCASKCYAIRMCRRRLSTLNAWRNNLRLWETNPTSFKAQLVGSAIVSAYFRYFVGGDIPSYEFLEMMVDVAKLCPKTQFLAFTKRYAIINQYVAWYGRDYIPDNLHIILSEWDKPIENPYNLPKARVIFSWQHSYESFSKMHSGKNYKICGGNCVSCVCQGIGCWELKNGETIYFHEH